MTARRKRQGARIADENEVLECLTSVLRGTGAEDKAVASRDRLRAAELLAKRYGALDKTGAHAEVPRIIDDIPSKANAD
ncbi:MAG: hypothetical protein JW811_04600 [Clostridiales bacterium]|nr:hypothetical protein [Clostridiales bacterium]